jgi:hypothetical protein
MPSYDVALPCAKYNRVDAQRVAGAVMAGVQDRYMTGSACSYSVP